MGMTLLPIPDLLTATCPSRGQERFIETATDQVFLSHHLLPSAASPALFAQRGALTALLHQEQSAKASGVSRNKANAGRGCAERVAQQRQLTSCQHDNARLDQPCSHSTTEIANARMKLQPADE